MWISRSLSLSTCHSWEEKKGEYQLLGPQMAHTTSVHIQQNDSHMTTPNHKGKQDIYSSYVFRKKVKQTFGEQLADSAIHPFSRMNLRLREARSYLPMVA